MEKKLILVNKYVNIYFWQYSLDVKSGNNREAVLTLSPLNVDVVLRVLFQ